MKSTTEWLVAFNQKYNNISSDKAPGLDTYEISVFLSDAQREIVLGLINGTVGPSFESTEQVANYLSPLVRQASWVKDGDENTVTIDDSTSALHIVTGSTVFKLPDNLMARTYESCNLNVNDNCNSVAAVVVPVTQDEYWRTSRDPFKGPNESKVLRLVYSSSSYSVPQSQSGANANAGKVLSNTKYSELVSKYPIVSYTVRYIANPSPIILEALTNGLSIDNCTTESTCLLDEAIHDIILNRAVQMARETWNA